MVPVIVAVREHDNDRVALQAAHKVGKKAVGAQRVRGQRDDHKVPGARGDLVQAADNAVLGEMHRPGAAAAQAVEN